MKMKEFRFEEFVGAKLEQLRKEVLLPDKQPGAGFSIVKVVGGWQNPSNFKYHDLYDVFVGECETDNGKVYTCVYEVIRDEYDEVYEKLYVNEGTLAENAEKLADYRKNFELVAEVW